MAATPPVPASPAAGPLRPQRRLGDLGQAVGFLTVVGRSRAPTPGAVAWFPVVGALVGLVLGGAWLGASRLWPPALAAAVVVVADLALTGMLHLDGLVDTADGLLPPLEPGRRLAVMADPGVGAFGFGAGVGVLLLRWTALGALVASPALLAALWCASRTAMALALWRGRPARPGGLASAFVGPAGARGPVPGLGRGALAAAALAAAAGAAWLGAGGAGLAGVAATLVGAAAVVALARRRLGGYTGDVLGAAGVVGETVGLVVAAARW